MLVKHYKKRNLLEQHAKDKTINLKGVQMNKLVTGVGIAATLALFGCGETTINDIKESATVIQPSSRVVFDPANGVLSVPNNLLLVPEDNGFFDFTLNAPADDPTDTSDPFVAINALDGWSTTHPFVVEVDTPANTSLDATTLAAGIRLYEATLGLDISDPECFAIQNTVVGCKLGDELTFGVDYVLSLTGADTINVVPLKPLKPAQSYLFVMTTDLKDSNGNEVLGSTSWELVRQDINTLPLSSESQLGLQQIVNSHVNLLSNVGLRREDISYVSAFTTQSTDVVLNTVKQAMIFEFAQRTALGDPQAGLALPTIMAADPAGASNSMEELSLVTAQTVAGAVQAGISALPPEAAGLVPLIEATDFSLLETCNGLLGSVGGQLEAVWGPLNSFAAGLSTEILKQVGPFCAAMRFDASITLPYYSPVPTAENPLAPVNSAWEAACDSGTVLAGAPQAVLESATKGPNSDFCMLAGQLAGGLLDDLRINGTKLDPARNLTRFNPIPQAKGRVNGGETLEVQITVPNPAVAAGLGFSISKPEAGWPVAILMHPISFQKESMLALTGALSLAGVATIAIDHPLHGSRGFDLTPASPGDELNATTVSTTHYLNLGSLLSARDNLRQSVSDMLGLRLGIHALVDGSTTQLIDFDSNTVSVIGVSLGAITGGTFAAVANSPMQGQLAALNPMFAVNAAVLESPGGGIANFLRESRQFGPLIKALLISGTVPEFGQLLSQLYPGQTQYTEEQQTAALEPFLAALSDEQRAEIEANIASFIFAAQTVLDAGDPINYGETLGANTPTLMLTVVGDGGENLSDAVTPVTTELPLSGQLPLANVIGLSPVVSTTVGTPTVNGITLFTQGNHGSSLNPSFNPLVTTEMQQQIATFIATQGGVIQVTNTDVIAN